MLEAELHAAVGTAVEAATRGVLNREPRVESHSGVSGTSVLEAELQAAVDTAVEADTRGVPGREPRVESHSGVSGT